MSFEHAALAMNHSQAAGAMRAVLIGIGSHANEDGEAFPGMMKLAQYGGYEGWDALPEDDTKEARDKARDARNRARRSAIKATQKLVELGEISIETNGGGTRKSPEHMRPNLYKVLLTCPPNCDHSAQHRLLTQEETTARLRASLGLAESDPTDPVAPRPPRGLQATSPVAPRPPESSINHQDNQDTLSDLSLRDDPEDEKQAEAVADRFENWHPGEQVARAAAQVAAAKPVKRPDLSKQAGPIGKVPPAPHYPRYDGARERAQPEARTPADDAAAIALEGLNCPAGTPRRPGHWLPPRIAACVQCERSIAELTQELTA